MASSIFLFVLFGAFNEEKYLLMEMIFAAVTRERERVFFKKPVTKELMKLKKFSQEMDFQYI